MIALLVCLFKEGARNVKQRYTDCQSKKYLKVFGVSRFDVHVHSKFDLT